MDKLRPEVNTRSMYAKQVAEKAFEAMKNAQTGGGNITTCDATKRFVKAYNIQRHYHNEFHNYITRNDKIVIKRKWYHWILKLINELT